MIRWQRDAPILKAVEVQMGTGMPISTTYPMEPMGAVAYTDAGYGMAGAHLLKWICQLQCETWSSPATWKIWRCCWNITFWAISRKLPTSRHMSNPVDLARWQRRQWRSDDVDRRPSGLLLALHARSRVDWCHAHDGVHHGDAIPGLQHLVASWGEIRRHNESATPLKTDQLVLALILLPFNLLRAILKRSEYGTKDTAWTLLKSGKIMDGKKPMLSQWNHFISLRLVKLSAVSPWNGQAIWTIPRASGSPPARCCLPATSSQRTLRVTPRRRKATRCPTRPGVEKSGLDMFRSVKIYWKIPYDCW